MGKESLQARKAYLKDWVFKQNWGALGLTDFSFSDVQHNVKRNKKKSLQLSRLSPRLTRVFYVLFHVILQKIAEKSISYKVLNTYMALKVFSPEK